VAALNSTTVRTADSSRPPQVPPLLISGLRALGTVSPGLAARAAERLFLTPQRHPTPAREVEALRGARPFTVPFRGGRLRAWSYGEGPAVLLVHGWSGRGGQLAAFAPPLLLAGFRVVAFDGPAHGASSGRWASVPLFGEALRVVSQRVGGVRAVIAHSFGAPAVTHALLSGWRLDAAVFVGPPRGPVEPFRQFCAALELPEALSARVRARLEARFGLRLEHFDVPRLAASLATPLLVVHDRGDAEVAWDEGAAIAAGWPGARLVTTTGLGHRRVLRAPEVLRQATDFISGHAREVYCACGRPARVGAATCATCKLTGELFDPSTRWVTASA
jgi:pimeloyl-ACP methyl ester carboxylesterase